MRNGDKYRRQRSPRESAYNTPNALPNGRGPMFGAAISKQKITITIVSEGRVSAFDEFAGIVRVTPVVTRVVESMMIEAAQALRDICRAFQSTGEPMGGHHLPAGGYMGETIVRALIEAELIEEVEGEERGFMRRYKPTKSGEQTYTQLDKEDAFSRRPG